MLVRTDAGAGLRQLNRSAQHSASSIAQAAKQADEAIDNFKRFLPGYNRDPNNISETAQIRSNPMKAVFEGKIDLAEGYRLMVERKHKDAAERNQIHVSAPPADANPKRGTMAEVLGANLANWR